MGSYLPNSCVNAEWALFFAATLPGLPRVFSLTSLACSLGKQEDF